MSHLFIFQLNRWSYGILLWEIVTMGQMPCLCFYSDFSFKHYLSSVQAEHRIRGFQLRGSFSCYQHPITGLVDQSTALYNCKCNLACIISSIKYQLGQIDIIRILLRMHRCYILANTVNVYIFTSLPACWIFLAPSASYFYAYAQLSMHTHIQGTYVYVVYPN